MSSHPGTAKTLELIGSLKTAAADFAAREGKFQQEFRTRFGTLHLRRDQAVEEREKWLADELAKAESAMAAAKAKVDGTFERRQTRIRQARAALVTRVREELEGREGKGKYKVQSETLQSKRNHAEGLASAEASYGQFRAQLAQEEQSLAALEQGIRNAFKGYKAFVRLLDEEGTTAPENSASDEHQLMTGFRELVDRTSRDLGRFRWHPLPQLYRSPLAILAILALPFPLVPLLRQLKAGSFSHTHAGIAAAALLALGTALYFVGRSTSRARASAIAAGLRRARRMLAACAEKCETRHREDLARVENEYATRMRNMEQEWARTQDEIGQLKEIWPRQIEEKTVRASARNEESRRRAAAEIDRRHAEVAAGLKAQAETRIREIRTSFAEKESKLEAEHKARWQELESGWAAAIRPLYREIEARIDQAAPLFPAWSPEHWAKWSPPERFTHCAQYARLEVDVEQLAGAIPKDPRLALGGPKRFSAPLLLSYPDQGSILFETTQSGNEAVVAALNNIILRLLSVAPPGRLNFTVIDPVGLGQNFAGVMHLADYEEHLINCRIWTQASQIEQKLADLNEHMEKVIQMYLRNEYATIAEYNEQAGNIAEKYHFLVVADFPSAFSEIAAKRLLSIAASGARCGVYTLIHWDHRHPSPQDFVPEELRKSSVCVSIKGRDFILAGQFFPGTRLVLDPAPTPEFAIEFIHRVGKVSIDSNRVEVPFAHVAPGPEEMWSQETTSELKVAIGRTGATKLQYLAMGKETRQHALLAGKTGSGKSTLFHVIITNLALWCSPEQVEFYLVDFKKGVEFKCYASRRLPHARVVAIESDREFGLSVLQRIDEELKRRGDLFRKLGVQDIPGYKKAGGTEPIPRTLLLIDEFQEFFVEDDKIAQTASVLLDRIVRQGRAFGIHVMLGSQTLGGAYTVARTTLGQMVIRIALQCNEADAYLIMDDSNPAPRLLSRPGEGIYNDTAGTLEGNSPFQVVWLPDQVRDESLAKVRERASRAGVSYPGPIIFEGNAPAAVSENLLLRGLLEAPALKPAVSSRVWLGAPNSIKGPTEAVFHRQSGNHLILVGQRDEAVLAMLSIALVSLAAQHPLGQARFVVCDSTPPGTPQKQFLERVVGTIPHTVTLARQADLGEIMNGLVEELRTRSADEHGSQTPPVFLFIHGLQKLAKLRYEEEFSFSGDDSGATPNPAVQLNKLICEGASLGVHIVITCDTYNNVNRFLSRKALTEFEMRVLFQMSANDSASLIDSPKASNLGLHRALFYNEQEGHLETFRPYALPDSEWLEQARGNLVRLLRGNAART